jgi:hypothetical protein
MASLTLDQFQKDGEFYWEFSNSIYTASIEQRENYLNKPIFICKATVESDEYPGFALSHDAGSLEEAINWCNTKLAEEEERIKNNSDT